MNHFKIYSKGTRNINILNNYHNKIILFVIGRVVRNAFKMAWEQSFAINFKIETGSIFAENVRGLDLLLTMVEEDGSGCS